MIEFPLWADILMGIFDVAAIFFLIRIVYKYESSGNWEDRNRRG